MSALSVTKANDALYPAIEQGNLTQLIQCLDAGADPNLLSNSHDLDTPLICVARTGKFWAQPAHIRASYPWQEMASALIERGASVQHGNRRDTTALHEACRGFYGDIGLIQKLLSAGADPNRLNHDEFSALHYGAAHAAVVQKLISHGADVRLSSRTGTPLHWACCTDDPDSARLLLDHGAEVDARRPDGATPLWMASGYGYTKVATLLVNREANVNAADRHGQAPLALMAAHGDQETCRLFLDNGAEVKAADDRGLTALHAASSHGGMALCELLLNRGANVAATDVVGLTALHLAAERGRTETVRLLVARGADPLARDSEGLTPADRARESAGYGRFDADNLMAVLAALGEAPTATMAPATASAPASPARRR